MMKLPELHYYDLYAPLVASVDLNYAIDDAEKHRARRRSSRSGPEYAAGATPRLQRALDRLAIRPRASAPGAYSNGGAYDVHPYMLLNYNGKYTDMSTLAHELGHTMHSYFSNKTQPYPTASLPDLRRRGRLDLQRGAADRSHAEDDQGRRDEAVAAGELPRGHQGDGVPADAVRRVRAARARDGGEGAAADRRGASTRSTRRLRRNTTATTRASRSSTTTSRTNGRSFPTSTGTSTCSSTRRRSPRPKRWRRR